MNLINNFILVDDFVLTILYRQKYYHIAVTDCK